MKKIIKSGDVRNEEFPRKKIVSPISRPEGIVTKEELRGQEKGQKLIAEAEKDAEAIRKEANDLKERVSRELEAAKEAGYAEGKNGAQAEWVEKILELRLLKEEIFRNAEPEILKMVVDVSEKILGKLTASHKDMVYAVLRQALERSIGNQITVRMHPADLKRFSEKELEFKDLFDRTKHLHFREDDSIERGGCVVETEVGTIDAQLEAQLKAIKKALGV